MLRDIKLVYRAEDRSEAEAKLTDFVEKWESKYPKVTAGYQAKDNLFTFLDFPESIRAKFGQRIHRGFKLTQFQIAQLFEEVYGSETRDIELQHEISTQLRDEDALELVS